MRRNDKPFRDRAVQLFIIQGTPFCNINCSYCYLPNRNDKTIITDEIIVRAMEQLKKHDLIARELTIGWHAGEPLMVPIKRYEEVFDLIEKHAPRGVRVRQSIQTNGVGLNDDWCEFIKERNIQLGLSVDGPEHFHDKYRKTKTGKNTHHLAQKAIDQLNKYNIRFHVICVLNELSIQHPVQLYDYFESIGSMSVGFNIDELEGANESSCLHNSDEAVENFWSILTQYYFDKGPDAMRVREFSDIEHKLKDRMRRDENTLFSTSQNSLYSIFTLGANGDFSSYSPELIGNKSSKYKDFIFGNVLRDDLAEVLDRKHVSRLGKDIQKGVKKCFKTCEYFSMCGGGAPSNKLYENGKFSSTETDYCNYMRKMPLEAYMNVKSKLHV